MGDPLKKVQAGERVKLQAETFNAFVDAARAQRARRHDRQQESTPEFRQTGIVKIKNASGADRARFEVLGIDEPLIGPGANLLEFKNRVALTGVVPDVS